MEAGTGKKPGSARAWRGSSQVRPCAGRHLECCRSDGAGIQAWRLFTQRPTGS